MTDLLDTLKPTQMVLVATCEGMEPRLRPMTLIARERRLWLATGATDHKTAQIAANPNSEFCLLYQDAAGNGYLRGRGVLTPVEEIAVKRAVADFAPFIYAYWQDAADPDYRLFEFIPRQLRYLKPGDMLEEVFNLQASILIRPVAG